MVMVVLAVWSGIGLFAYVEVWRQHQMALAARDWPSVPGQIVESRPATRFVQQGNRQIRVVDLVLRYDYQVSGRTWSSDRVSATSLSSEQVPELLQRYPVGASVQVYVNPTHPEQAVLQPAPPDLGAWPMPQSAWLLLWLTPNLLLLAPIGFWCRRAWARSRSDFAPTEVLIERALHRFRMALAERPAQAEALALVYLADQWLRRPDPALRFSFQARARVCRSRDDEAFAETSRIWQLDLCDVAVRMTCHDNHADLIGASQTRICSEQAAWNGAGTSVQANWLQLLSDRPPETVHVVAHAWRGDQPYQADAASLAVATRLGARPPDRLQDNGWMRVLGHLWLSRDKAARRSESDRTR